MALLRHVARPRWLWIGPHAVDRVAANDLCKDSDEAAHMPSRILTEPMRRSAGRPQPAPLSMRRGPAGWAALPARGRARRFAWPPCGTERFLGRNLRHDCRQSGGTQPGLSPYSCLVPPRSLTYQCHFMPTWAGNSDPRNTTLEPSRRSWTQHQHDVVRKTGKLIRL